MVSEDNEKMPKDENEKTVGFHDLSIFELHKILAVHLHDIYLIAITKNSMKESEASYYD